MLVQRHASAAAMPTAPAELDETQGAQTHTETETPSCTDTPDWNNGPTNSRDCDYYGEHFCANGAAQEKKGWTLGADYKNPEDNCCVCGKGVTAGYQKIQSGSCATHSRAPINGKAACSAAAAALGLYDTTASDYYGNTQNRPEGCYYKPDESENARLQYNYNSDNAGSGCDNLRYQICGETLPTPSPTAAAGCGGWCAGDSRPWSTKCAFRVCSTCPTCEVSDCEGWCYHDTRVWETKCTFGATCSGCPGCSDLMA